MANKKKSKPKTQGKKSRSRKSKTTTLSSYDPTLVKEFCAVSDPFCKHARTVSPAGSRGFSVSFTQKLNISISTGTNGTGYLIFRASYSSANYISLSPTTSTFPATTVYTGSMGAFNSIVNNIRVVSAGVKWHSILPSTAVGGTLTIVPMSDDSELLDGLAHNWVDLFNSPNVTSVDLRSPGSYVLPLIEPQLLADYKPSAGTNTPIPDLPFGAVLIQISGPNGTPCCAIDLVINYEGIIDMSNAGMNLGRQHPERPLALAYQKQVAGGYVAGTLDKISKTLKERAIAYANKWSSRIMDAGIHHFLPSNGPTYPMIEDVD